MATTRPHFRPTTAAQRRLLFATWEATGNVTRACRTAHVGRRTFYYWKPPFEAAGYADLDQVTSSAPKQPQRVAETVAQQIITLRQAHPTWGKHRIAHELAKAHTWHAVVSATTVKRILRDAGLWGCPAAGEKKGFVTVSRTADMPGQTVNIDLCFVPAQHVPNQKVPAVSGSSGRLVVERPAPAATKRTWLGQIFADPTLEYAAAMQRFARASHQRFQDRKHHEPAPESPLIRVALSV
jgi:transposase